MTQESIGIIGLGYVGLPLAVAFGKKKKRVVGFDANLEVTETLLSNQSHVQDISDGDLEEARSGGLTPSNDLRDLVGLDAYIICVPTPLGSSGHPDLAAVEAAGESVGSALRAGALVVLESTTYPGTTEEILRPILESRSGLRAGEDFDLAYSPERIDPGNAKFSISNTPKIVGGLDPQSTKRASQLYAELGIPVVEAKGIREAELAKLLENTYRHVNIALVNEMAKFCRALDIDLYDAIQCAATKPFGFEAFYPGPGVGGHCIPIDPNYLSFRVRAQLGYPFRFVELAQEINASMPAYVVSRIQESLNEHGKALNGARVLLLGVTYKRDVADRRESPADPVARALISAGATLQYGDPFVDEWEIQGQMIPRVDLTKIDYDVDCVVILQDHSAFSSVDFRSFPLVFDTRGSVRGPNVCSL
jgi:UDP-N-acetyl-D-glucosamine dehydrogenase